MTSRFALLCLLALAFLPNPVPGWLRVGVAGLGLGSFLVGLLWPYTVGPLGSMPGAVASLVGAVMLMSAGIVSVALGRHAEPSRGV